MNNNKKNPNMEKYKKTLGDSFNNSSTTKL